LIISSQRHEISPYSHGGVFSPFGDGGIDGLGIFRHDDVTRCWGGARPIPGQWAPHGCGSKGWEP
jgi:hypothetical protein